MFDEAAFAAHIEAIRAIARRRGGAVTLNLPPPAPASEVELCQAFFDLPLPPSLTSLWRQHAGFSLRLYGADDPPEEDIATYQFDVRGPSDVLQHSKELRHYFAGMYESGVLQYNEQRARRYADIVDFGDADRIAFAELSRRDTATGESPILEANVYEAWPTDDAPPLAASTAELIERCLHFMIQTEGGFRYWMEPYYDW